MTEEVKLPPAPPGDDPVFSVGKGTEENTATGEQRGAVVISIARPWIEEAQDGTMVSSVWLTAEGARNMLKDIQAVLDEITKEKKET